MNRDQIVRDTAYAIWEAEGKPDGRAADHWRQAEARVSASLTGGKTKAATGKGNGAVKAKATAPAKGKALDVAKEPAAKPPAKAAATKKAPAKAKVETAKVEAAKTVKKKA